MNIKLEIRERIVTAANTLVAEGVEQPTNEQVREHLGGGSLSHISPVMREWRAVKRSEIAAALTMPADLKKAVESSLAQVWAVASRLAAAQVEGLQREAQARVETVTAERDEALADISRLEARIADVEKALAAKEQALRLANVEREKQQLNGVKLAAENTALTTRLDVCNTQLDRLRLECEASRADNKQLQAQLIEIARQAQAAMPGQTAQEQAISTTVEIAPSESACNSDQRRELAPA